MATIGRSEASWSQIHEWCVDYVRARMDGETRQADIEPVIVAFEEMFDHFAPLFGGAESGPFRSACYEPDELD